MGTIWNYIAQEQALRKKEEEIQENGSSLGWWFKIGLID